MVFDECPGSVEVLGTSRFWGGGGNVTRLRCYMALLAAWVTLTLVLTSIPNPDFGPTFPGADKVAHFGFYGVTGFLVVLWRRESGSGVLAAVLYAILFSSLLGAADEFHQQWIPGRSMEFLDWTADSTGGIAGGLTASAVVACIPSFLTRKNQSMSRPVTD